jgi:hypothetical protein
MWGVALGVLAGLAGGTVWIATRRWEAESARVVATLRSHERRGLAPFHERDLAGLPAPVVRYFRHVLREGQPLITSATITWEGEFNMGKPGRDNWRPFTAVQEFVPGAPGFVWKARIAMLPGVPVFVRDSFVESRGSMRGAVWGLIPVVTSEGTPMLASSALQRYLGEAAWFPTALLPRSGVQWTAVDDTRARATLSTSATPVSLEFRFDEQGQNLSVFAPDRFYDDGRQPPVARPWEARNSAFGEQHGVVVATESVAEWQLPQGPFAYWRGRPTRVEYRLSAPDTDRQ